MNYYKAAADEKSEVEKRLWMSSDLRVSLLNSNKMITAKYEELTVASRKLLDQLHHSEREKNAIKASLSDLKKQHEAGFCIGHVNKRKEKVKCFCSKSK